MKAYKTIIAAALLFIPFISNAQPAAGEGQRLTPEVMARLFPAGVVSPDYHDDGSVTFRFRAPQADTVKLECQMFNGTKLMEKDENGVWSITVTPEKPNIYPYAFQVDGTQTADPNNMFIFPNENFKYSLVDVRGAEPSVQDIQDVPHGKISYKYYHSTTCGFDRPMCVYTPAGYDPAGKEKLPVLYLIHGGGDNDSSWPTVGAAGQILDNLLAEGKIEPMVVVMPNGTIDNVPNEVPPFAEDMVKSIIPFIEANYPVYADKDHRAIAGLSMGGMESMETSFNNIDKFSYVWVLSASFQPGVEPAKEAARLRIYENADKINKSFKMLVFTEGGPADIAYQNFQNTRKELDAAGIKYEYKENAQSGHTWNTWRHDLYVLAQRIFR